MKKGLSKTRIYSIFSGMKTRCYNKNCKRYKYYGAKGVKICEEWLNDIQSFIDWSMSNGYNDMLTIDRIDSDGDYCPENCRWISKAENTKYAHSKLELRSVAMAIGAAIVIERSSRSKVATKIGITESIFDKKVESDSFTNEELAQISEFLDFKFKPYGLLLSDGTRITIKEK